MKKVFENKPGIYKITNIINNKSYIGSSINISSRIVNHKYKLKSGNHDNKHLQYSFNKYSINSFKFEVLEYCKKEELLIREQYYVDLYKCIDPKKGYNKAIVVENTSGYKWSKESRIRFSEYKKQQPTNWNAINKMIEYNKTKRIYNLDYLNTKEIIDKRNNSHKKIILQYSKEGEFIREWLSATDAGKILNINNGGISTAARGERKTYKGFIWKYKENKT